MLFYYMTYILISPLIGIILMEQGQFGPEIALFGHSNGATTHYIIHLIVFLIFFRIFSSKIKCPQYPIYKYCSSRDYASTSAIIIFILTFTLVYLIFIAGAYKVWTGDIGKGEFRSTLGRLGALTYFLLYFVVPSLIALVSIKFNTLKKKTLVAKILLSIIYFMAFIFGASWGFKGTAVSMLIPGLIFIFWKIRFPIAAIFGATAMLSLVLFSMLFDGHSFFSAVQHVLVRMTIIQGNIQWFIWEQLVNKQISDFTFLNFLWASFGDTFISHAFHSQPGTNDWIEMHYTSFITRMIGYSDGGAAAGHNVQGGIFSEAILSCGYFYAIFSAFSGAISGYFYGLLKKFYMKKQYTRASMLSTYFIFIVLSWINSGGVVILIHIATVIGFIVTVVFLKLITYYNFYFDREAYRRVVLQ